MTPTEQVPTAQRAWPFLAVGAGIGVLLLVVVMLAAGGAPQPVPPPLPDPGMVTGWALPVTRLLAVTATTLAVGLLLAVVALLPIPDDGELLSPAAGAVSRYAGWAAAAAAVTVSAQAVFTLSQLLAIPPLQVLDLSLWGSFVGQTDLGVGLVFQVIALGMVVVFAVAARTRREAAIALLAAAGAAVLPVVGSHSATEGSHGLAIVSLAVHLLAATLWVGGLAGLGVLALRTNAPLAEAVRRFSFLALCCAIAVGLSGVVNAITRLDEVGALIGSGYGLVLVAKAVAFGILVALGWLHRQRTVPLFAGADRAQARPAFLRLAAVELLVMAGTYGIAVGLARTPPPAGPTPLLTGRTPAEALLGYPLPEAPTPATLLGTWHLDAFGLAFALVAAPLYLAGVRVLQRRGVAWPLRRTVAWLAGVAAVVVVTCTGVGRYAPALFSVHMVQHMTLNMVAPLLLVLGAPVTLALRALPSRDRRTLLRGLRSRPARFLGHPFVATGIFIGSLFLLYFTPLFEAGMRNHWGHLLMQGHFLASGFLFFWLILGIDPDPGRPAGPLRVPLLLAVVLTHTIFAMVLVFGATVIAKGYYSQLAHPWALPLLEDQALGGAIAWVLGETTTVLVLAVVILQWFSAAARADQAAARVRARRQGSPVA